MIRKIMLSFFVLAFMNGCVTESSTIQYYKLGSSVMILEPLDSNQPYPSIEIGNRPLILIEPIMLADFLRRQGLVIQKAKHQLQISNVHRWAESLEGASSSVILRQLEHSLPNYRFENQTGRWKARPKFRLSIQLSQFQVNNKKNQVVTSGKYWLFDEKRNLLAKQQFLIEEALSKNGYEHAISKLELSLVKLSKLISDSIREKAKASH